MAEITNHEEPDSNSAARPGICIIGAGNVATHLAKALSAVADVRQIVSRHQQSASRLAASVGSGCLAAGSTGGIIPDADFYIIAANDDSIAGIADSTPDFGGVWAHTSGSVPMEVFAGKKSHYGVFYPLQTFTRDVAVDMSVVPFFIEGNNQDSADRLASLARMISSSVEPADSNRRKALHVAAVFACNFANLMWMEADDILHTRGLGINYLMPLLRATLEKLESTTPRQAMTGPARRGDKAVIESHLQMLPPDKQAIYALLSETILKTYHNDSLKRP